jgi:hypothetical protein
MLEFKFIMLEGSTNEIFVKDYQVILHSKILIKRTIKIWNIPSNEWFFWWGKG